MPSLVDIMKARSEKRADLAEFESRLARGGVNPSKAISDFEQSAIEHYREMIRSGQLTSAQAHKLLRQRLQERPGVEQQAFESGTSIYAPTYQGAGLQLGMGAGLGWGLGQLARIGGGTPPSFGQQVGNMLLPRNMWGLLPLGLSGLIYAAKALHDPKYQRGEKGYAGAVGSTVAGAGREMRKRMGEAEQRYGAIGAMPLHAFGILADPVAAASAGVGKVKDVLLNKQSELSGEAAAAVSRALRKS